MGHDVFISYSSKQKVIADGIKHYLEEHKISCWMAPYSIPPSSSYPAEINKAISQCKVCILVYSNTAALSQWVQKEVNQAINFGKGIIPFRIEQTENSDFFDFILSNIHWIEAYPHYADQLPPLLKSVCSLLDRPLSSSLLTNDSTLANQESNKSTLSGYSIGDVISVNNQKGIIFYLDDSCKKGKIVSVDSCIKQWCSSSEYLLHRDTGAAFDDDGKENLERIKQIPGWETQYPAFRWCAKKGADWYLPTTEDFHLMNKQKSILAKKLGVINENKWFWSSEQDGIYSAKYYHFLNGQAHSAGKTNECIVVAVADFELQ